MTPSRQSDGGKLQGCHDCWFFWRYFDKPTIVAKPGKAATVNVVSLELKVSTFLGIVIPFLFKLVGDVAIWIVDSCCINFGVKSMCRALVSDGNLDARMIAYLVNFLAALVRVILVVSILVYFGVQTASFAALLAGACLAMWVPPRTGVLGIGCRHVSDGQSSLRRG